MEMPRARSMSLQSLTVPRRPASPWPAPAEPITRACRARASVSVDLPASGWLMTAKVRRRAASGSTSAATAVIDGLLMGVQDLLRWYRVDPRLYGGGRSEVVEQLGGCAAAQQVQRRDVP